MWQSTAASDHLVQTAVSQMSMVTGEKEAKWKEKNNEAVVTLWTYHTHVLSLRAHTPDIYTHEIIYTASFQSSSLCIFLMDKIPSGEM